MRAVTLSGFGEADVLEITQVPDPEPGVGELLVGVRTSGINRADLLQRRGNYPAPPGAPANIPGLEFAGVVEEVGPGVTRWAPGDRVMGIVAGGGYAERVVVHERSAIPVPDGLDWNRAGAIPEVFLTAFDAVFRQAGLLAGETVLIHAVGSGVGTAALQLARRAGARTIGTSRTPSKLKRAAGLGLDHGVLGGTEWVDEVRGLTGDRGVDVILDLVGGPYLPQNQKAVAIRGRHIVVGVPGGARSEVDLRLMMVRRARIMGTVLRARPLEEKAALSQEFIDQVLAGFTDGSLQAVVDRVLPAAQVADAHRCMEANENFGKILISWESV